MIPEYTKLGKEVKDLFDLFYNAGAVKIDVKNKVNSALKFDFISNWNTDNGQVQSSLETKYKFDKYGFSTHTKWTTENDVMNEILVNDKSLFEGFKLSFNTKYALVTGKKSGNIKSFMEGPSYNAIGDLDWDNGQPRLNISGLLKYNDILFGGQGQMDLKSCNVTKQQVALAYVQPDVSIYTVFDSMREFNLGIYKKVNACVERGVQLTWDDKHNAHLSFGLQHFVDFSSTIKAKINDAGHIGLAYVYQYSSGLKVAISTTMEAKNLLNGAHKMGVGLTFEG